MCCVVVLLVCQSCGGESTLDSNPGQVDEGAAASSSEVLTEPSVPQDDRDEHFTEEASAATKLYSDFPLGDSDTDAIARWVVSGPGMPGRPAASAPPAEAGAAQVPPAVLCEYDSEVEVMTSKSDCLRRVANLRRAAALCSQKRLNTLVPPSVAIIAVDTRTLPTVFLLVKRHARTDWKPGPGGPSETDTREDVDQLTVLASHVDILDVQWRGRPRSPQAAPAVYVDSGTKRPDVLHWRLHDLLLQLPEHAVRIAEVVKQEVSPEEFAKVELILRFAGFRAKRALVGEALAGRHSSSASR